MIKLNIHVLEMHPRVIISDYSFIVSVHLAESQVKLLMHQRFVDISKSWFTYILCSGIMLCIIMIWRFNTQLLLIITGLINMDTGIIYGTCYSTI